MHFLGRALCAICLALAMGIATTTAQDCIDYGSYLRWLGGVRPSDDTYAVAQTVIR